MNNIEIMREGPDGYGIFRQTTATMGADGILDSADNMWAIFFNCPKDGTITKIGLTIVSRTGTPPAYQIGFVLPNGADYGNPSTTLYSNSSWESISFSSTGFMWKTLSTPVNVEAGDQFYVVIKPGGSPPDGSNNVAFSLDDVYYNAYNTIHNNFYDDADGYWSGNYYPPPGCLYYSTGDIMGFGLDDSYLELGIHLDTDPDEAGVKFTLPYSMRAIGFSLNFSWGSTTIPSFKLYDDSDTVLWSKTWASRVSVGYSPNYNRDFYYFDDPITFEANKTYRLTGVPAVNTSTSYLRGWNYGEAGNRKSLLVDASNWCLTYRTDSGSWTDILTSVPSTGLLISGIEFPEVTPSQQRKRVFIFFD